MTEKPRCKAIKEGGERCRARAQEGYDWCWNHRPDTAEERKENAAVGGKSRLRHSANELERVKQEIRTVTAAVLKGGTDSVTQTVDKGTGAVVFQGLNTYLRCVEVQRKLDHQKQLEEEVAELRAMAETIKVRRGW